MFLVSDAVVDNYVAIVMLSVGGAERLSFSLLPEPPTNTTTGFPRREHLDSAGGLSVTASVDNVTRSSGLLPRQSTVGYSLVTDQIPSPVRATEPVTTTSIVGPMIYVYFSTDNSSDAGFTVDLLFKHHSYAEASHRSTRFCFILADNRTMQEPK